MKKIFRFLIDFHADYFNLKLYLAVAFFIASLITFNYALDFEDSIIDSYYGRNIRIAMYFAYHAFAYYGVLMLIHLFKPKELQFTWRFWLKSFIGLLILGIDRSVFPNISRVLLSNFSGADYRYFFKLLFNVYGFFTIVLSLVVVKLIFDRKSNEGLYGLNASGVGIKSYLVMLLIMMPIIFIATYLPGFLEYYPTLKRSGAESFAISHSLPYWLSIAIYEVAYLCDFLNTELFFRGFLVIGLSRMIGKNAVLPMAATYAVLHFGKPMGETISSVFGGYILGIIALYSRNIWGGVFIHGGIALLMEIFAFARN
ncbi:MAG TPA: CPBP family intramembrane metalloprotease [Prolixibacteraceae bacterium]|nr:CPBP family intramembrane metalloprotease [Prolixibacteraceae bacterium]